MADTDIKLQEIERNITVLQDVLQKGNMRGYETHPLLKTYRYWSQANLMSAVRNALRTQYTRRDALIAEREKEEQYLRDQELKQQQAATEAAQKAVEEAQAAVEKAKGESAAALAKAQQELAKAEAAKQLAQSGDMEAQRILLGQSSGRNYKPLIIGGIAVIVLVGGFIIYKMIKK